MEFWPGHRGYTPTFTRSAMGFLMTTVSLTSRPKDRCYSGTTGLHSACGLFFTLELGETKTNKN